eukprot:CAMPEP_0114239462 /NCGR_PEP_ID=MMETSP0058-20121206/8480_1 /TAXON_ID=36894 /ORGANISM="Pyramimonas parkeae, CCMP726" /LENGTH=348 /DNA_ID=CAMNT_0001351659 /DNA_START=278 /DNA_END=1324 /DNA_ORIENTATION=-
MRTFHEKLDSARVGQLLGQEVTKVQERRLQSLWAGYGSVASLTATLKSGGTQALIVKRVDPPREADSGSLGDARKLRSYQVEGSFYKHLAPGVIQAGVCVAETLDLQKEDNRMMLLMTDLTRDFPCQVGSMNVEQAKAAAEWLAGFHAHFWERPRAEGVWEQGGYWYLDTRPDEFEAIGSEWNRLKAAAKAINWRVKGGDSNRFRTLIHGDFKAANILHSSDGKRCAAYDFQYVGEGYGVRDMVMLLHSSLQRKTVPSEEEILKHYHQCLCRILGHEKAKGYDFDTMMMHYDICVADYVRFMAGWGFWGTDSSWTADKASAVLDKLDGGRQLKPEDYLAAVKQVFPVV